MTEMTEEAALTSELQELVGKEVCVAVSVYGVERNGFFTQMSIHGELEGHPEDSAIYRVVNSQKTYTYFRVEDVIVVNPFSGPTIIHIKIDQRNSDDG